MLVKCLILIALFIKRSSTDMRLRARLITSAARALIFLSSRILTSKTAVPPGLLTRVHCITEYLPLFCAAIFQCGTIQAGFRRSWHARISRSGLTDSAIRDPAWQTLSIGSSSDSISDFRDSDIPVPAGQNVRPCG